MADVSVQMGVSGVSQFKQGMAQAQASVKSIDAALKLNEKQFKATGDAETYMQNKTTQLNQKLAAQQTAAKNAEQALKAMKDSGVDPLSTSYQKMETQLLNAQSAILDTQNEINNLGTESAEASGQTDKLADSLSGLNKKVSLDQVISAVGSITGSLEKAAGKAIDLGKAIWENVMDSAKWADDTQTMALMYGVDLDTFLRVQKLVENGLDTSVEAILKSQSKLKKNVGEGSESFMQVMRELGLVSQQGSKYENFEFINPDSVALFWEAGQAIMNLGDEYEQEAKAQALFGKSWRELIPLFSTYKSQEEFSDALAETNVNTEEEVSVLAELNDKVAELKGNFETLENKVWAGLAPALTTASEALSGLLDRLIKYLETPEGQKALDDMSKAVEGLFSDITEIDPEEVVKGFSDVFNGIVGGLQWLEKNSGTVISAMETIVAGWGLLKLAGGALEIYKLIQGITGLTATSTIEAAGRTAGTSWGGSFASAVLKAAPWLLFLYELLNPAETQDNSLVDANGNLTAEGLAVQAQQQEEEERLANRTDRERWLDEMAAKYNGTMGISAVNMEMFGHDPIYEAIQDYWDKYRTGTATTEDWTNLQGTMDSKKWEQFMQVAKFMYTLDRATEDLPNEAFGFNENFDEWLEENGDGMPIMIDPVIPENAADLIAEEVGPVMIPVQLEVIDLSDEEAAALFGGQGHANGLWSVPFDGYRAILHKGERVVPAREVGSSRNFSSNLYVESMYMNNGQDADGLAAAMAAAQRRTMSGYGS